ncbi:60S ribosomal protein L31B [Conglomerata obtusa]
MNNILRESKIVELTINLKKITNNVSWKYKAPFAVRNIKRLIQKNFHSEDEVLIAPELNKAIWVRGMKHVPKKVRIRVEKGPCTKNPEKSVFRVSLVIVGGFKGLLTQTVAE